MINDFQCPTFQHLQLSNGFSDFNDKLNMFHAFTTLDPIPVATDNWSVLTWTSGFSGLGWRHGLLMFHPILEKVCITIAI